MGDPGWGVRATGSVGDVGSKAEIYRLIGKMAQDGVGILVLSTEIPEVLGIADRIVVVRKGQITAEYSRNEATQEALMTAATVGELSEVG